MFSGWVAKVPGKLCQQIKKKKNLGKAGVMKLNAHMQSTQLALRFSDLVFTTGAFPQHRDADTSSGKQRCTVGSDQARGGDAS